MQVYFTVESGKSCADLSPFLQGAYIVYLETGTNAYSSPSSYGFYMGTSSTGGSSTPSYPGAITSVTAVSVQGWVEAKELGSAANSSVTGDFAATFCP